MKLRLLFLTFFSYLLYSLHTSIHNPETKPHIKNVHKTSFFAFSTATAVNVVCSVGAYATQAVPRGMESDACMPYSMITVALASRLHIFHMGGYHNGEWRYVGETPGRWMAWAGEGFDFAIGEGKRLLEGLSKDISEGSLKEEKAEL